MPDSIGVGREIRRLPPAAVLTLERGDMLREFLDLPVAGASPFQAEQLHHGVLGGSGLGGGQCAGGSDDAFIELLLPGGRRVVFEGVDRERGIRDPPIGRGRPQDSITHPEPVSGLQRGDIVDQGVDDAVPGASYRRRAPAARRPQY